MSNFIIWKKSYVSGLRIKYNINKPVNQRVVEVKVLCADCDIPEYKLLDDNKMYGIILSNFLLAGGDGYSMIRDHAQQGHIVGKVYCRLPETDQGNLYQHWNVLEILSTYYIYPCIFLAVLAVSRFC